MTVIALAGDSRAIADVRRGLERSPLDFAVTDERSNADLLVTDEYAPSPNYRGVAAAAVPNTFFVSEDTVDYVLAALTEAHLAGAHGVRVRETVQRRPDAPVIGLRSRLRKLMVAAHANRSGFDPVHYDWASAETVETEVFDDEVRVQVGDEVFVGRLRARGHVDGNDGHFHWAGILHSDRASELKGAGKSRATVSLGDGESVPARLAELTPWGTVRMTGVGPPPWQAGAEI